MLYDEIKNVIVSADKKKLRQFGLTIGFFILIVSIYFFFKKKDVGSYLAGFGILFILFGWMVPVVLKPIYIVWMSAAATMGFIMTRIILSVLFLFLFMPASLAMRILRKDPLKEKIEPNKQSYWIKRKSISLDSNSIENQY